MRTRQLESLKRRYERGEITKTEIERTYLGIDNAKGKAITRLWYNRLGVDTRRNPTAPVEVGIR